MKNWRSKFQGVRRWLMPTVLTALGLLTGGLSWLMRDSEPWWSSALINVSVVFLLLVPGEYAIRRIWRTVETIEKTSDSALVTANAAATTAEDTARSLADVREKLLARQHEELDAELGVYRRLLKEPSHDALQQALLHAGGEGLTSEAGVRVEIWETPLHYRYRIVDAALVVNIEEDDGRVLSTHSWPPDVEPDAFFQALVEGVRAAQADLGVGLNDPTQSLEQLADMLIEVTRLRSQELLGHRQSLRKIIQRRNGWYFTETAVYPAENLHYEIAVTRLNEMDWETHLRHKGWYDAEYMLPFARRLYGIGRGRTEDETQPDASSSTTLV
ncbi:hypothetical protein [Agrococcus sp. DT81.2]|uniref:hypothetical protein n=1 Tax=Agrococcus sp. DT81.2 TaxID=3393414 RepID=UPI003CE47EE3